MLPTVQLDCQMNVTAGKIQNIRSDRMLAAKFKMRESAVTK